MGDHRGDGSIRIKAVFFQEQARINPHLTRVRFHRCTNSIIVFDHDADLAAIQVAFKGLWVCLGQIPDEAFDVRDDILVGVAVAACNWGIRARHGCPAKLVL